MPGGQIPDDAVTVKFYKTGQNLKISIVREIHEHNSLTDITPGEMIVKDKNEALEESAKFTRGQDMEEFYFTDETIEPVITTRVRIGQ
jgi:hypothetical protein